MQRKPPKNAYFDTQQAEMAVLFIENCCVHPKGSLTGKPFILEPWQKKEVIEPLFGWRDAGTDLRKFTTLFLSVPRKNGKTVLCAAIGLYLLVVEQAGTVPEIVSLATDEQQARIVFSMAATIVSKSPILQEEIKVLHDRLRSVREPASFFKPINREGGGKHGLSPSGAICDEVAQYQPAIGAKLLESIETGFAERENPLAMYISTCGSNYASNLFAPYWQYAKGVISGKVKDDNYLPCIYGANEDDDWTDPKVWAKANPNLGISVRSDFIKKQAEKAMQIPTFRSSFQTYHLNMWVKTDKQWLNLNVWDKGNAPPAIDSTRRCWGGLDASSTNDLTSFVLVFEPDDEGVVDVLPWFWVPRDTFLNSPYAKFYEAWTFDSFIEPIQGAVIDLEFPRMCINSCAYKYNLQSVGLDRWGSSQLVSKLNDYDGIITVGIGMGFASMSSAVSYAERLIYSKKIRHGGHPVLRWCLDNTVISLDPAGNKKPDKSKSSGKIDGTIALLLALKNMDDDLIGDDSSMWGTQAIFEEIVKEDDDDT